MLRPRAPRTVRLFVALVGEDPDLVRRGRQLVTRRFGASDDDVETDWPQDGGGPTARALLVTLGEPAPSLRLVELAHEANQLESLLASDTLALEGAEPVAVECGFVDEWKLVIARLRDGGSRVHIGSGVYAEIALQHSGVHWEKLPWTGAAWATQAVADFADRVRARLGADRERMQEPPAITPAHD